MNKKPTEEDLRRAKILRKFAKSILKEKIIEDPETMFVVHWACTLKANQLEGKKKKRGPKKVEFKLEDPEFAVAYRYAQKKCSYEQARGALVELCNCDERTAERYLKQMKWRAEFAARVAPDLDEVDLSSSKTIRYLLE